MERYANTVLRARQESYGHTQTTEAPVSTCYRRGFLSEAVASIGTSTSRRLVVNWVDGETHLDFPLPLKAMSHRRSIRSASGRSGVQIINESRYL